MTDAASQRRRPRRAAPGSAPGTLAVDAQSPRPVLRAMCYGPEGLEEKELASADEIAALLEAWPVTWLNIDGLGDESVLRSLADAFGLHALALEDVVHTSQRPKVEQYDGHHFIVLRVATIQEPLRTAQVSLFVGERFVVTFQERAGTVLEPVRARLRTGRGRIRSTGADYLTYAIIDTVVDNFFPVLEHYGELIEALQDEVIQDPDPSMVVKIHEIKRALLQIRRALWPKREALSALLREDADLIQPQTRVFLRDCYDHTVQLIDMVETYRELASGLMDVYLTSVSNRMNEVMKVLTIIATIFIPLSFIAGLYGMNFDTQASSLNMPELAWPYGYALCLSLMAAVAVGMLAFFRRKGWIGGS